MEKFIQSVVSSIQSVLTTDVLIDVGTAVLFLIAAAFILWINGLIFPRLYRIAASLQGRFIKDITIGSHRLIGKETLTSAVLVLLRGARLLFSFGVMYAAILLALKTLPFTHSLDLRGLIIALVTAVFILIIARFVIGGFLSLHLFLKNQIEERKGTTIQTVSFKSVEILSAKRITEILLALNSLLRLLLMIMTVYITMTSIFGLFDFTREWSALLLEYTITPLQSVVTTFVSFLPNLFTILVILAVTRYLLKFIRLFFHEMETGGISFPGFHREWAVPTYKIVRFLVMVFAVIVIFPYLPGSDSPFFQGISVFLGILFSLGSSSAISNIVAGTVLTYMRPFRIGDRVKIADTQGDVMEKSLLVTRLRTNKNVEVTIPNSMVLGSHIINYSANAKEKGLILHTTVTIGYDAPWRTVHQLLVNAALKTAQILPEPKPFVLQTALNDFYVAYELNASTADASSMAGIYSEMHQNIQDEFNAAGIEIMSPHYSSLRDGNAAALPKENLPKDYVVPGIKVDVRSEG